MKWRILLVQVVDNRDDQDLDLLLAEERAAGWEEVRTADSDGRQKERGGAEGSEFVLLLRREATPSVPVGREASLSPHPPAPA